MPCEGMAVLDVKDLNTVFETRQGPVHAVNAVSFTLRPGEVLGVVGESGSGKSVTMMSLLGLLPSPPARVAGGHVQFANKDLLRATKEQLRGIRGAQIGYIFQDPMTSLNPVFTVGYQLMEPLREHSGLSKSQAKIRAAELLALVGISDAERRLADYPHAFSGGMRQRVMIAMALACDPKVLIADEPTTALDVTIQAQILELMKELRHKLGMSIIWITHDLGVIAGIADRVMVMYGGQIVEQAPVHQLFKSPQHPYTKALIETLPKVRDARPKTLQVIEGQPPVLRKFPQSCSFNDRCQYALAPCRTHNPSTHAVSSDHTVACHWNMMTGEPRDA